MVRTKHAAQKKPRFGYIPPNRAHKTVSRAPDDDIDSARRLPAVPSRITNIISSANKPRGVQRITSLHVQTMVRKTRFQDYSIPKKPFQRIVRDTAFKFIPDCRFTVEALTALQTAAEDFMIGFFEDAALCMRHAKRKTLLLKDIELVARLRKIEYESL